METMYINHFAVFTCAVVNLVWGAIWYSPALFFKAWKKANGLTDAHFQNMGRGKMYALSFLLALLMSYNMAFFLGGADTDVIWGITAGFLTGFGWCAAIFAVIAVFELRPLSYILINGGYIVGYFTIIGCILGIWR